MHVLGVWRFEWRVKEATKTCVQPRTAWMPRRAPLQQQAVCTTTPASHTPARHSHTELARELEPSPPRHTDRPAVIFYEAYNKSRKLCTFYIINSTSKKIAIFQNSLCDKFGSSLLLLCWSRASGAERVEHEMIGVSYWQII